MERQTNYSLLERYSDGVKDCTFVKFLKCGLKTQNLVNQEKKTTKKLSLKTPLSFVEV